MSSHDVDDVARLQVDGPEGHFETLGLCRDRHALAARGVALFTLVAYRHLATRAFDHQPAAVCRNEFLSVRDASRGQQRQMSAPERRQRSPNAQICGVWIGPVALDVVPLAPHPHSWTVELCRDSIGIEG